MLWLTLHYFSSLHVLLKLLEKELLLPIRDKNRRVYYLTSGRHLRLDRNKLWL